MLGQAKEMQEKMQQKLAATVVEASSVRRSNRKMNGKKRSLRSRLTLLPVASLSGAFRPIGDA